MDNEGDLDALSQTSGSNKGFGYVFVYATAHYTALLPPNSPSSLHSTAVDSLLREQHYYEHSLSVAACPFFMNYGSLTVLILAATAVLGICDI